MKVSCSMPDSFIVFPEEIFRLFSTEGDADVLTIAGGYVPIAVLLFFGAALRAVMNALINGSGNYRINFVTAILDGVVMRIGHALLFGLAVGMKHYGFWLGDALAGFTPFWIGLIFYFTRLWKKENYGFYAVIADLSSSDLHTIKPFPHSERTLSRYPLFPWQCTPTKRR